MSTIGQATQVAVSNRLAASVQQDSSTTRTATTDKAKVAQSSTAATTPQESGSSLMAAVASLGARESMVTEVVYGPNNQVSQIRVLDAVTHQVISSSPPDSIAHMQLELEQYQDAAKSKLGST